MKYQLNYCNRHGNNATLDIIIGSESPVEMVEGTGDPFVLRYSYENESKKGRFLSSSAEINIYESGTFNIDNLKTLNEKDIKVVFTVDSIVRWIGYVVPDFFRRSIGPAVVVTMTASDRIGAMRSVKLTGLNHIEYISSLITKCLEVTGIPAVGTISSMDSNVPFEYSMGELSFHFTTARVFSQLVENMTAYDILHSILVSINGYLFQRNGDWRIYNKYVQEGRAAELIINEINPGAETEIVPVAQKVGILHKRGGNERLPVNGNFSDGINGWTVYDGFVYATENRNILGYTSGGNAIFGEVGVTSLRNINGYPPPLGSESRMIRMDGVGVRSNDINSASIELNIRSTGRNYISGGVPNNLVFRVIALGGPEGAKTLNGNTGMFEAGNHLISIKYYSPDIALNEAVEIVTNVTGLLESANVYSYDIHVDFLGTELITPQTIFISNVDLSFSYDVIESAGNLYRIDQGSNFSKEHEIEDTVFGDFITSGLNGYFYTYNSTDVSSLLSFSIGGDSFVPKTWIFYPDSMDGGLLLQKSLTQISDMFSIAHNKLRGTVDMNILDPRANIEICGKKYVIVSAEHDFLRSISNVVLEEVIYNKAIPRKNYRYTSIEESNKF